MNKPFFIILLPFLMLAAASAASFAEIYKWTDASGKIHFGDKPPQQSAEKLEINTKHSEPVVYEQAFPNQKEVIMYGASWCGYCKKARQYFTTNNIAFTEYDVEKNGRAKREYDALGASGYPLILIGDQRMQGFSIAGFNQRYQD